MTIKSCFAAAKNGPGTVSDRKTGKRGHKPIPKKKRAEGKPKIASNHATKGMACPGAQKVTPTPPECVPAPKVKEKKKKKSTTSGKK